MIWLTRSGLKFFLIVFSLCLCVSVVSASDWAYWRGPEQNGVSREKDLPAKFSLEPGAADSNLLWKVPHGGRSTPIVMGGRVYINNQVGESATEQERVMCFDADTGKVLWEKRFNVYLTDIVSVRLGWTNLAGDPATGNIYWHGTQGDFICFDKDGKILWQRQLTEQDGRISGYGGRIASPVVDGELVIIGMINSSWGDQAKPANRFLAMNKRTGTPVWWSEPAARPPTYFCTPVVAVINGQRLLISGCADGAVHAMNIYTGQPVWSFPLSKGAVNSTPVVAGTKVYMAHGDENLDNNTLGRVACVDAGQIEDGKPKLLWKRDAIAVKFTTPILHEGRLYVCDDLAKLYCLDAATGKPLWRRPFSYGRNAMCSPVWADGKIYVADKNAKFHILEPGKDKCKELYEQYFPSPDGTSDVEIYANPAVANGRVYFMTREEIYCIGKKNHSARADPIPPPPKEPPLGAPAAVRVFPADVTLHPGGSAQLWVHVLDKHGREINKAQADDRTWSLPAPPPPPKSKLTPPPLRGSIEENIAKAQDKASDGSAGGLWNGATLKVAADVPSQQGMVLFSSKLGKAKVRVRVAPTLPYALKVAKLPDGATPGGWVNAQGKFFAFTLKDGAKVLRRNNTNSNPSVARANAYIGLPSMTDYTIEADVQGSRIKVGQDTFMPDVGVVANRYTLALWGNLQRLRLTSWDAIPRVDEAVDYPWKPGTWYRLKLTVEVQGDKAVARGKVWPRDEKEPKGWTVEFTDATPNREGAPALYGLVTGHVDTQPGNEIYYDNVRITPNKSKSQP
jgi:outer membrane protein assembly factor BamB